MKRILYLLLTVALFGASPALAATFNHAEHDEYIGDMACSTCHQEGDPTIVPDLEVCSQCHDAGFVDEVELPGTVTHGPTWALKHRPFAKGNTYDCSSCHQQDDCLECHKSGFADEQGEFTNNMMNVHRSDFQVTHPIAARTDPQLCSSCHESRFCSECHDRFAPADLAVESHRRGWSDLAAKEGGALHETFDESECQNCHSNAVIIGDGHWSEQHAREARKNLATCQTCHPQGDVCLQCHSAKSGLMVNPHPSDWGDIAGRLRRASSGNTCIKCH